MRRYGATTRGVFADPRFLAPAAMEFWTRFALTGIKSLLVLTLIDHVLPVDAARVVGGAAIRAASARVFGPVSVAGLASQIYGYALAALYLATPVGGLAGDCVRDRRSVVLVGGATMIVGLVMMLGERSFLIGLLAFAIGTGAVKGNLSAEVGLVFADEAARRRGYTLYLGVLNAGAIAGAAVCGALASAGGTRIAIAVAASAVVLGLAGYLAFARGSARDTGRRGGAEPAAAAGTAGALLVVALVAIDLCYAAYDQIGNVFLVWARDHVDLGVGGGAAMPVGWFLSLDGMFTLALIVVGQRGFAALDRRGPGLGPLSQIALGASCCAAGYLVLAIGSAAGGGPMALPWALLYLLLVDAGVVLVWPAGLSLVAAVAPRGRIGLWTGLFHLHGFVAGLWVGASGVYYDRAPAAWFWLVHAGIAVSAGLLILVAGVPLIRRLRAGQATSTSACAKARA